jgi:hypothetical protein
MSACFIQKLSDKIFNRTEAIIIDLIFTRIFNHKRIESFCKHNKTTVLSPGPNSEEGIYGFITPSPRLEVPYYRLVTEEY